MSVFLKTVAGVLTAVILWISLNKNAKDYSVLLTLAVCAMVILSSVVFLQPIVNFLGKIQEAGSLDSDLTAIILKSVGIGILTEVSTLICKDAGNESMGKALQILATTVVLWISIPVFERLLSLLDEILGAI